MLCAAALACGPSDPPAADPVEATEAVEAPARPPIPASSRFDRAILVTIDTLRADHVGVYGSERARTATLDGLARRGVRFEHAIAPVPVTLPSHTSLMTGLQPPSHGVRHNGMFALEEDVPVLAEQMRSAGFATAAFVAAVVLDPRYGLARGFDTYDADVGFVRASKSDFSYAERSADRVVDAALEWLESAPDEFFVWVHLYDPHADYSPPPAFQLVVPGDPYGGEIAFADAQVGRLLKEVEARWPRDRTLVVVTSDHGEAFGEHGEQTHSYGVYDATQRVPLILAGAGVPSGVSVPGVVRLIDVAPTVLSLGGVAPLEGAEGTSLEPLWQDPSAPGRTAYVETLATRFDMGWSPLLGIRTDEWKYIRAPSAELYDLRSDPQELENLHGERAEKAAELDRLVDEALARTRLADRLQVDAEQQQQLESLGYVVEGAQVEDEDMARVAGPDPKDHMEEAAVLSKAAMLLSEGKARETLEALEGLETGGIRIHVMRSKAALKLGDHETAERAGRALIEKGDPLLGRVTLGFVRLEQGRLDEAEAEFRTAYEESTHQTSPVLGLARVAETRGDLAAAERLYREAMERSASAAAPRWRLAVVLIETGREGEGRALLAELPAREREKPEVLARVATAELKAGHEEEAIAMFARVADAVPDNVDVRKRLIVLLDRANRSEEALARREELHRLTPDEPMLQNNLAWYLAAANRDLDRALALARRAIASVGEEPSYLDTLATVHLARDEPEAALAAADRALATGGAADPHLHYVRGAALAALGRRAEARDALAVSLEALDGQRPDWAPLARALERELEAAARLDPSAG